MKNTWKKFRVLLPVLTSHHLSYKTCGHVYSSCMQSTMLHASETLPFTKPNRQRLQLKDRAMIRQICSIKPEVVATVRSRELLAKLEIEDLGLNLREKVHWFGHVERSSGADRTSCEPLHEISNNVVCATSKGSDLPAHTHSLLRAYAGR